MVLLWVLGLATVAASCSFAVMIFRKKSIRTKPLMAIKYVCIALVPLTWGIGSVIAESDQGRHKAACLGMLLLLLAACAAYLSDTHKDV